MNVVVSCENSGTLIPDWLPVDRVHRCAARPDRLAGLLCGDIASIVGGRSLMQTFDPRIANVAKSASHRSVVPAALKPHRHRILADVHQTYLHRLRNECLSVLLRQPYVIHLSIHTFDPRDRRRGWQRGDVGFSYDPKNSEQLDLVLDWVDQMYDSAPMLKARRNHPTSGSTENIADQMGGLIGRGYVGIGVHLNRHWAGRTGRHVDDALRGLFGSLVEVLNWVDDIAEAS